LEGQLSLEAQIKMGNFWWFGLARFSLHFFPSFSFFRGWHPSRIHDRQRRPKILCSPDSIQPSSSSIIVTPNTRTHRNKKERFHQQYDYYNQLISNVATFLPNLKHIFSFKIFEIVYVSV
jgi:hypothetical protein